MEVLATLAGIACGVVLSIVPGLHVALVLTLMIGLLSTGTASACFIAAAAGVALYLKRLGAVYHPNAASGVASLDPALRLTAEGKGPLAVAIMKRATDTAFVPVALFAAFLSFGLLLNANVAKLVSNLLDPVGVVIIVFWLGYTSYRSKAPWLTFGAMLAIGLFGYVVFNHPGMMGDPHQMAPVMSGLFGIPIMAAVFLERSKTGLPPQQLNYSLQLSPEFERLGAVIGCATGFLAGLGTQSLVSMAINKDQSNEEVLSLTSAGEASNDIMAILLVLVASMGRSGEAVLLGRMIPEPNLATGIAAAIALLLGAWSGRGLLDKLQRPYLFMIRTVPVHFWAVLVMAIAIGQVLLHHSALLALGLTAVGVALSWYARENEMPLQVSFAALALPILVQSGGLVPMLNSILF